MTIWQPASREPDALRAAIFDYLRNRSAQVFLDSSTQPKALGRESVITGDGGEVVIDLSISPADIPAIKQRACLSLVVAGHAATRDSGWQVDGQVILDRQTLAFLTIDVALSPVSKRVA